MTYSNLPVPKGGSVDQWADFFRRVWTVERIAERQGLDIEVSTLDVERWTGREHRSILRDFDSLRHSLHEFVQCSRASEYIAGNGRKERLGIVRGLDMAARLVERGRAGDAPTIREALRQLARLGVREQVDRPLTPAERMLREEPGTWQRFWPNWVVDDLVNMYGGTWDKVNFPPWLGSCIGRLYILWIGAESYGECRDRNVGRKVMNHQYFSEHLQMSQRDFLRSISCTARLHRNDRDGFWRTIPIALGVSQEEALLAERLAPKEKEDPRQLGLFDRLANGIAGLFGAGR